MLSWLALAEKLTPREGDASSTVHEPETEALPPAGMPAAVPVAPAGAREKEGGTVSVAAVNKPLEALGSTPLGLGLDEDVGVPPRGVRDGMAGESHAAAEAEALCQAPVAEAKLEVVGLALANIPDPLELSEESKLTVVGKEGVGSPESDPVGAALDERALEEL